MKRACLSQRSPVVHCIIPVIACALMAAMPAVADKDSGSNDLAQFYGFSGLELYKLDARAFNLTVGDFDSDGRNDIVTIDNRSSSLRFFRQRTDGFDRDDDALKVNEIEFDRRFDDRQIPVDKMVAGLASADFNNDGRSDFALIGVPDRLVVRYQPEPGVTDWTKSWSVRLPELEAAAWMITAGDLNGDSLTDIAVLGKKVIYVVYQSDDGTMQPPVSLINTSSQLALLQAADLNGDGRTDLSYRASEGSARGLCARLQAEDGKLGPEIRFDLSQPRSITLGDVDGRQGAEVLTIDDRTSRVVVSHLKSSSDDDETVPGRLVRFGIGETGSSQPRSVAVGDIDGDQLSDVIVTDSENAQMLVYRQNGIDGLETAEAFPGLLGATDVCLLDGDRNTAAQVVVMSAKEAVVGQSRFRDGRLTFPKPVARAPEGFEPVAIQLLRKKDGPQLLLMSRKGTGSRSEIKLQRFAAGGNESWKELGVTPLPATAVGTRGVRILPFSDSESEDETALIVPSGSGNKGVLLLAGDSPESMEPATDLGVTSAAQLFTDRGALYVARESFARKLVRDSAKWSVSDQFNAGESRARISGVAVLNLDESDDQEIVLVDTGIKKLRILKKEGGLYRRWKEVDLGVLRYSAAKVVDLNGDDRDDLLLVGLQQFAVLYAGSSAPELQELTSFDIDKDESYPADVLLGDINADGQTDLTVIDSKLNGVQLLNFDLSKGLRQATKFRVFEEKRLVTKSSTRGTQPREGIVADVTNDGRNDLILLCHDRLIVYPQDSGQIQQEIGSDQ